MVPPSSGGTNFSTLEDHIISCLSLAFLCTKYALARSVCFSEGVSFFALVAQFGNVTGKSEVCVGHVYGVWSVWSVCKTLREISPGSYFLRCLDTVRFH